MSTKQPIDICAGIRLVDFIRSGPIAAELRFARRFLLPRLESLCISGQPVFVGGRQAEWPCADDGLKQYREVASCRHPRAVKRRTFLVTHFEPFFDGADPSVG